LWEAAVKATKRYLYTVTKDLVWTFEEYYTLVEIELILNFRPFTPLSSDPNDLSALTPAHFLLGDTLLLPAEHSFQDIADNKLSRWQHVQKLRQHFWKRWREEYLHELQRRHKWRTKGKDLEIGILVLVREDNMPPLQWTLGRIHEMHPGQDNVVRKKKSYKLQFFQFTHKSPYFPMIIIKFAKKIYSTPWNASNYAIFWR